MLRIDRRANGIYRVRGTHHGVVVNKSTRTRDTRQAEALKEKWEREIFDQKVLGKRPAKSFAAAAEDYLISGGEGKYIEPLLFHFLHCADVSTLNQSDLDKAAMKLYPDAMPSTRNRHVYTPFIAVMKLAADNGHCTSRRWRRPKQPEGRTDWRTPAEMELILAELKPRARGLVTFMLGCFPRATEAINLEWRDISPGARRVTFWETKGGYARSIDLPDRVIQALPPRIQTPEARIWRTDKDNMPWHAYDAVNLALKRACDDAGVSRLSCHVLRHTGATWHYALHRDLVALMNAGGWRSLTMVQRYVHAGSDDLRNELIAHGWSNSGQPNIKAINNA